MDFWLFYNILLAACGYLLTGAIFSHEIPFSLFFMSTVLIIYSVLYALVRLTRKNIYGYLPPHVHILVNPKRNRRTQTGRKIILFIFNSHFFLLIASSHLLNYFDGKTYGVRDLYPVVSGNIVVFFKHQQSLTGTRYFPPADREVFRIGLHSVEIIKRGITDLALRSSKEKIKKDSEEYYNRFFSELRKMNLTAIKETISSRVRYNGKPPVNLMNIDVYKYSGKDTDAVQNKRGITRETHRNPPLVSGPHSLRKGFSEKEINLIPSGTSGADFPDSINFLRYYYIKKEFTNYYSEEYESGKRTQGKLVGFLSPPFLVWINNDCYEHAGSNLVYLGEPQWAKSDHLLTDNRRLLDAFFNNVFREKIYIEIRGFQIYEDVIGQTARENLGVNRYFRPSEIISLPPVRWKSHIHRDAGQAIHSLHELLSPVLNNLSVSDAVHITYAEKEVRSFSSAFIFFSIIVPYFLWILCMCVRYFIYVRAE